MSARVDNSVVIGAPIDYVWSAMNELERWPSLFTEYAGVEILERHGDTVTFRLTTHPDPEHGGQVWSWVSERTADPVARTSHSHRIETGPFEFMNIEWYFVQDGPGTRMRWVQEFTTKISAPANDEQATEYLNRNTRIQMESIKGRLEASYEATKTSVLAGKTS